MSEASTVIPAKTGIRKNEVLEGWQFLPIKEFAHTTSGGTPKRGVAEYYNGDVPWIKSGDLNDGILSECEEYITQLGFDKSSAKLFKPGTLLIALYGATIGRMAILNFEASTNQAVCGISVPGDVDVKYLFYYLLSIRQTLIDQGQGGAQPNINQQIVKETVVPLAPPEQQKRIVAKIEELFSHVDAGIEVLKKAKQLLKQYRQSVLKAAVTGELTKEWREANKDKLEPASQLIERILKERRQKWEEQQLAQIKAKGKMPKGDKWKGKYKEPVSTKDWIFLSELPDAWTWASVDQIGDSQDQPVLTGPFGSNLGKSDFIQEGVPVLTIGCLQEEGIDLSRAMHVSEKKSEELERYQLKEGDMLFSRMAAVGRAGFVTPELAGALFNYHIMRLRLHPHAMLQEYFVHYVRGSNQVYDYVKEVNHGATRDGINTHQLLEMPVALAPLQEQKEICKVVGEKLGAIRRLESDINVQLLKAEKNKKSILASAFSGRLN